MSDVNVLRLVIFIVFLGVVAFIMLDNWRAKRKGEQ